MASYLKYNVNLHKIKYNPNCFTHFTERLKSIIEKVKTYLRYSGTVSYYGTVSSRSVEPFWPTLTQISIFTCPQSVFLKYYTLQQSQPSIN